MANTSNTSTLTTDFNVAPYYDDYDPSKGYYRIISRPGRAIQAREVTQMQTMMQQQISRFGKHFFKEGSIVLPGLYDIYSSASTTGSVRYVKVKDTDNANNDVNITEFLDQTVTGSTSGITGSISFVLDGSESSSNTKTIYVDYTSASTANAEIKIFQEGEVLTSNVGNLVVVSNNATGFASAFRISEGVFFAKEHFISFNSQGIILDRYNSSPSCKVGFRITEDIYNSTDDLSLLDPALESSNYSAPGADRLRLNAVLQVLDFENEEGAPDFVTLFTIKDGVIQTIFERSQYNILQDEMAKRTFDESGHYYVEGMQISLREHLNTGTNGGRLASANGGNSQYLSVQISPGVAYVQGYEVGKLVPAYTVTDKARDYSTVNSQLTSAAIGSYVTVKEFTGSWGHDTGTEISLYDSAQSRLTTNKWSTGAQTGNKIGSAKLVSVEYNTGTMGTPNAKFDVYLTDIRMLGSNTFSSVKSLYYDNTSGIADMGADVVLSSNTAVLQSAALNPLLYYVGSDWTKTIKPNTASDTTFTYKHTTSVSNVASGTFNVSLPSGASQFPYGTANLSDTQKRQIIVALGADANVAMAGTITSNGTTIDGSGTDFNKLNIGDKLIFTGVLGTYYVNSIANSTSLTVTSNLGSSASGVSFSKVYKNGDIVDLTSLGATGGTTKTVSTTPTQLSFNLQESMSGGTIPATVSYQVSSTSSPQINKTLKSDRFVRINVANSGANTSGPFKLGIPDVWRIKEIRSDTVTLTSNTQGSNVTAQYVFDNGQRDGFYDHASIRPINSVSNTTHLLVRLDYFSPDYTVGKGFFSIDSYPIDDSNTSATTINTAEIPLYKSPTSGAIYDLRNYLDFRPVSTQSAADSITVSGSSVSPGSANTFQSDANGLRIPAPFSQISFDYQYYLARKDVVIINKDGTFSVIRGNPASVPITPEVQDSMMAIGTITITPYPSISQFYANIINRKDLACSIRKTAPIRFTMRDIGVLKDRIINLEKYAALSLLEKAAADMKILDANGLDRFKNGIFVDTFSGHELGATYNNDYTIVVDPQEKSIRPIYSMDSVMYDYTSGTNVTKTGDIVTLSFTEVPYITQNNITTTRNTERTTYRFLGQLELTPSEDVWVDTQYAPDQSVSFGTSTSTAIGDAETAGGVTTTWNSWRTYVTGYKVYRGNVASDANLVGQYSDYSQAQTVADSLRSTTDVTIETLYASDRTGVENWTIVDQNTQSLGEKVIDVSLTPYIRPQIIKIRARGLKPWAKYYTYFDSTNMSNYATPLTEDEFNSFNIITASSGSGISLEGSELRATANGDAFIALRLPPGSEKRFTFGAKEVRITDSPNNTDEATSIATAFFTAQGLVQTLQDTVVSTRNVVNYESTISQSRSDPSTLLNLSKIDPVVIRETVVIENTVIIPPETYTPDLFPSEGDGGGGGGGGCCLAYAFQVRAPRDEDGIFVTSIDVYVADKHPTLGIWFELLELDNSGGITQNQVPFSAIWKTNDEIPLDDGTRTNPLRITFQAPIFLKNDKSYAFAMHPEAINPNYYFWCARIGETDINTGKAITSRLYNGTLYTTNNGVIWGIVPDVDLAFTLNRASFVTNTDGVALLGNKSREKFLLSNVSSTLNNIGETYRSGDRLTLSSITGGTIAVTDYLIGSTSAMNSAVMSIGSTYNTANQGYSSGETVVAYRANGLNSGVTATATVSASARANAVLQKSRETSSDVRITMKESNGKFATGDYISTITGSKMAKITNIDNFRYSVVDIEPSYLQFNKSTIVFSMKTYSNTGVDTGYTFLNPGDNYFFSEEKALYSRTNEIGSLSSERSNQLRIIMRSQSEYQSPVLDLGRTHSIIVDNIINNDTTGETSASGGNLYNRYISKTVTLAEGQDAEDMSVVLTSYRPPTTDVKVWVKILHAEDADLFAQRPWIELEKKDDGDGVYSSLANRNEFIEYSYGFPSSYLTGPLGQVQYRNSADTATFTGYKYFAIKIGLLGENSAIIPRCADLRVLALQI